MQFGLNYFPTHDGADPGTVARLTEERGLSALYFAEHTHMPVDHTPFPGGGPLPRRYGHTHELFVALATAAAASSRIRIGSSICLITERDPIVTAKAAASLDVLSGGRLDLGVGAGWNRPELRDHGVDPRVRMAVMAERVEAMIALWTREVAVYEGSYVSFGPSRCEPKPLQHPHPPVLVGGAGPTVLDRVLRFGDGWLATHDTPRLSERVAELEARAPRPMALAVVDVPADPGAIEAHAAAGFARILHDPGAHPTGRLERALDAWEAAISDFLGA